MVSRRVIIGTVLVASATALALSPNSPQQSPRQPSPVATISQPVPAVARTREFSSEQQPLNPIRFSESEDRVNVERYQPPIGIESDSNSTKDSTNVDPFSPGISAAEAARITTQREARKALTTAEPQAPFASADYTTTTENSLFETLSELQAPPTPVPFEQRIYGSRSGGPAITPPAATPTPGPTATPTVTPTPTIVPVGGQPTGYMMLQFMEPAARASVERQVKIMLDSKVMTLYLSALVDGTFDEDYAYLENVVRRLNSEGRSLTLALFFANGSAQRRYETSFPGGIFNNISPADFRFLIQEDPETQARFRTTISEALPVYELNASLNPRNENYAFPLLEDNLDQPSYVAMRRIARTALNGKAEVMRNPCPGCAKDGLNDADPLGSGLESHDPAQIPELTRRDGFTLDGISFAFPDESFGIPLEEVKALKETSVARGLRFFGLWRAQRQGLGPGTSTDTPPSDRIYEVPSEEQAEVEIELLRWGLPPISP
jgi:hypothetical protein